MSLSGLRTALEYPNRRRLLRLDFVDPTRRGVTILSLRHLVSIIPTMRKRRKRKRHVKREKIQVPKFKVNFWCCFDLYIDADLIFLYSV